jgi:hypothetical protein
MERDFEEADWLRDELVARGWDARRPDGPSSSGAIRDRLRPQRRARGLRGLREVSAVW